MSPYRTASTRVDESGPRWGATWRVKLLVRWFRPWYRERREEAREIRSYHRRLAIYESEVAARRRGEDPTKRTGKRPRPDPPAPCHPPRRVLE